MMSDVYLWCLKETKKPQSMLHCCKSVLNYVLTELIFVKKKRIKIILYLKAG